MTDLVSPLYPWKQTKNGWERRSFRDDIWVSLQKVQTVDGKRQWHINVYASDGNDFKQIGPPVAMPAEGEYEASLKDAQNTATYVAAHSVGEWYTNRIEHGKEFGTS